jgi:hypothetical protein
MLARSKRPKCGVFIVTKIITTQSNAAKSQRPSSTKISFTEQACSRKKALSFLFEKINALKKQLNPAKAENPKKRKAESLLSKEIDLNNNSDEMEEYLTHLFYLYFML